MGGLGSNRGASLGGPGSNRWASLGGPGMKPGASTQVVGPLQVRPLRGGLRRVRECGPELGGMRVVVMRALISDVSEDRLEFAWAQRLGPVADLPAKMEAETRVTVEFECRSALHALHERREGRRRGEPHHDVHVVRGATAGQQHASAFACFAPEDSQKAIIQTRRQTTPTVPSGPYDVNEQQSRRASWHARLIGQATIRLRPPTVDAASPSIT